MDSSSVDQSRAGAGVSSSDSSLDPAINPAIDPFDRLLNDAAARAIRYRREIAGRAVVPTPAAIDALAALDEPTPEVSAPAAEVIDLLDRIGSPATIASAGGRYFGFVTGSSLPATVAATWLAAAWDQNMTLAVMSPIGAKLETVASRWIVDLLGFPSTCGVGFVTSATMANLCGLAAARHALLARQGWDVEARGLFDAPPITVVVSDEVHVSLLKALSLLGFGRDRVIRVPVDDQGRMRADGLPPSIDDRTIVCLQAGNVNTGAFDPADAIVPIARAAGAWVHVDGAFGLWAAAAPARAHLMRGYAEADSWATDAHKWLNVPYDSGLAIVREPRHLREAMTAKASYLVADDHRDPSDYTPELSRRPRGIEVWAALRALGRQGLADLVERNCRQAARFAERLRQRGFTVLNDVVINQVMVSFGDAETTRRVIAAVQRGGDCWMGGTVWQGHTAMRISVSSWLTTDADVDRSVEAIARAAAEVMSDGARRA
jgi:glutamate/tyrosine decarboxylase-like PLP-dependent enzyme